MREVEPLKSFSKGKGRNQEKISCLAALGKTDKGFQVEPFRKTNVGIGRRNIKKIMFGRVIETFRKYGVWEVIFKDFIGLGLKLFLSYSATVKSLLKVVL